MSLKLKPKLKASMTSPTSKPPRNSFTDTDYYRKTRDEYYSPVSYMEFWSPGSPYASLPEISLPSSTRLTYIHKSSDSYDGEVDETGAARAAKRTANFWHVFEPLFRKWFRQKEHRNNHGTSLP
ncbi:hypothetical protein MSAN_01064600 [Mycena sanguinolenta]|uniref:Uncharacterized protein n=1 Tax=Mycena sanguinolenta TaxID=230812 RepID=A0A8H6YPZ0_9AGAR|nr:hypothetical protein MSAN_01064600 [Mycena sanguinolenta]